ncbi:adenosylcobinamide-phosphate synthase CbiB [Methanothermococcus sp.]|uniref:adenosylcobinamide-phosphate synthase CbiB n=1 Tax=Methanothermococcus sp. TaxID=2614238 RepID=UPI0025E0F7A6|nr:adenosylcobinamide-phosphate synthase CbiB [Methanothermococcus sp.]
MINPTILIISIIFDRIFGEPPEKIHPVVWIGNAIYFFEKLFKSSYSKNKIKDFVFGVLTVLSVVIIVFTTTYILETIINKIPNNYIIVKYIKYSIYSFILSTTIGYKSLLIFSKKPIDYLKNNDLENARESVQCIVSRDASKLDGEHILSASIESASENITDSIVAPLFYAALFGLPGAFIYRTVNTLDAMIGYRNEKYEYYGKFAAYLDDLLNFIPSRIAGILLIISAPLYGGDVKKALYGFLKEGHKTPSLNSGYTMATLSNGLNMTLEKIGYYKLGCGKIDIDKAYNSLKAIDIVVFMFLVIYSVYYLLFIYK